MGFGFASSFRTNTQFGFLPRFASSNEWANAYIALLEAAYGGSLGVTQDTVVRTTFDMIYGIGTPNESDLSVKLLTNTNARLFLYTPQNDSTASFDAYRISANLQLGTFYNFVGGDISVYGVIGSATKYLDFGSSPSVFSSTSYAFGVYSRTNLAAGGNVDVGVWEGAVTKASFFNLRNAGNLTASANNQTSSNGTANVDSTGLYINSRRVNTDYDIYKNGSLFANIVASSTTASSFNQIGHASGVDGTPSNFSSRQLCGLFHCYGLTGDESEDLAYLLNYYNSNIITGGRNTY